MLSHLVKPCRSRIIIYKPVTLVFLVYRFPQVLHVSLPNHIQVFGTFRAIYTENVLVVNYFERALC